MEAIRVRKTVEKDGEIVLQGLPCKKGESVEMILLIEPSAEKHPPHLTSNQLLRSGLIGLWKARSDIVDSSAYARRLREQAQRRQT